MRLVDHACLEPANGQFTHEPRAIKKYEVKVDVQKGGPKV